MPYTTHTVQTMSHHRGSVDGVLAIDIDLGLITAWSSVHGVICDDADGIPLQAIHDHKTVLVETVSPFFYSEGGKQLSKGEVINRLKWAIFNAAVCAEIYQTRPDALFSPSSDWTLGYPEEVRETMAGCFKKFNHDIRACISMVFFYRQAPSKWVLWPQHLNSLVKG